MNIKQLRCLSEVVNQDCNISRAAEKLFTSQPGVSKQLRSLERELGLEIFLRRGKQLRELTPVGEMILLEARAILEKVENIQSFADDFLNESQGSLSLATTHTQSRYVLPRVIQGFMSRFPGVALHMHQGTPTQISQLAVAGEVDFAIATEALAEFRDLVMMPCYRWNRAVLVPRDHPLCAEPRLSLRSLARHPLVTYTFGFTGRSKLDESFQREGLTPRVVFTAADADVIKTYVRLGLGVGIVASMAWDPRQDEDLVALDASHLFAPSTTHIGFRRGIHLRRYMYEFIEMFAPHLDRDTVRALAGEAPEGDREARLQRLDIPLWAGAEGGL